MTPRTRRETLRCTWQWSEGLLSQHLCCWSTELTPIFSMRKASHTHTHTHTHTHCTHHICSCTHSSIYSITHSLLTHYPGIAPLFLAARGGHCDLVRALLKNKAAVNLRGGKQQLAPLHWAAHKEREDIALLLIRSGADILLKDRMGRMPLSMAAPELASKMTSKLTHSHTHSHIHTHTHTPSSHLLLVHTSSNIPSKPTYGVYISQLVHTYG